jgi:hypothetical protein
MQETQTFEDELKEVAELNLILITQNQELTAILIEETQLIDGNFLILITQNQAFPVRVLLGLIISLFLRIQRLTCGPWHDPRCS